MSLKTCKVCGKPIASNATVCPGCGHRYGDWWKQWLGIVGFFVVIWILMHL